METTVDVLVIGGGQAGLSAGYYLQQAGVSFIIVDSRSKTGDNWRSRYDSLVLFTPRPYSSLPGMPFPGSNDHLPTKDEVADYLSDYADKFAFAIHYDSTVTGLTQSNDYYMVVAGQRTYKAKSIIIATGPFQQKSIPAFGANLSADVNQLHSS